MRRILADKNRTIAVLALCYFFVFGLSNVCYFLPVYYARTGTISPRESGLIVSVFYIVSVFSRPFLAYVLSSLGFRRLFTVGGVLFVASSAAMAFFGPLFWPALISRAVQGFASSLYKIGFSTYQALAFGEGERGRAYSLIMAGELLPLLTIAPIADGLIKLERLELYILVPVFMSVMSVVVACLTPISDDMKSVGSEKPVFANPFQGMGHCLRLPAFRLALLSMFLFSMTDAAASFMSSMTASYGLMASIFLSSNAFVGVAIRLFFTGALDRFSRGVLAAMSVLLTSGAIFMASINPTEMSLGALGLLFGAGMGFGFPLHLALVADSVPRHRQAQASAMMWFVIGINFSIVPLLMGMFEEQAGPVATFRVIALIALVGSCALCLLQLPARKPGHELKS